MWYRKASDQRNSVAERRLSELYAVGIGVPRDPAKAYFWSAAADRQDQVQYGAGYGSPETQKLAKLLTPAQRRHEVKVLQVWLDAHRVGRGSRP